MMKNRYNVVKGHGMLLVQRQIVIWLLPLFLNILPALSLQAQEKKTGVKGLVENERGEALEGVTVDMKSEATGTKRSTVTGKDGVFTFDNPGAKGTYVFTFSHVGYTIQTIRKENLS